MVLRLVLAVLVTVSLSSSDLAAQRQRQVYSGITVYDNPDFRGTSATFRDEIPDLRRHGLNDRVTSLEVEGNQAWEVCQDINFGGRCRVFAGSVEDLRDVGWNDRISSLRPVGLARDGRGDARGTIDRRDRGRDRRAARLVLYDRPNYRGDARDIVRTSTSLGSVGNRARSVRVDGGTWELCEGVSRKARCVTVVEDVPDLKRVGLKKGVDSVREVGGLRPNR